MKSDNIRPEWIPSGYRDKIDDNQGVKADNAKSSLSGIKGFKLKYSFKRKVLNRLTNHNYAK